MESSSSTTPDANTNGNVGPGSVDAGGAAIAAGHIAVGSAGASGAKGTHGPRAGNAMDVVTLEPMGGAGDQSQAGGSAGDTAAGAVAAAGAGGSGDAGGTPDPTTLSYPPLDFAAIGMPMQIASGFSLAESPLWDPCSQRLLFADVSAPGGGALNWLDADGTVTAFMTGTGNTNGLAWDVDGSLILAQMNGHLARRDRSGMVTQLDPADSKLHTPDDVVVRSDGTIYLSDGNFCPIGDLLGFGTALPVFTIKPNTTTLIDSGTVRGPNGIELSPDEKILYVNGYGDGTITRFHVMDDGTLMKEPMPFVTGLTDADSTCLDAAGNLYVAVSSGIQVLRPDGSKVGLIRIAGRLASCTKAGMTNCTFGGEDGKTLYITSWTALYKIDNMPIPGLDWFIGKKRAQCM